MRRGPSYLFLVMLLVLVPTALFAQTAQVGVIAGTAKDETGAVLPGVNIEARHQEKGFTRTAITDATGQYRMASMPPGPYTVTGTLSGFDTTASKNNIVETEKTTQVDLRMKLGAATEAITVTGEVPVVDRTNVTAQNRVRDDEFQKLPMTRNYQALIGLAPGVVGTGNVNAHGALSSNNQFIFDGADVTDPTTGTFGANLNFEAIQEVNVMTSGVSAEYGRAVGAIVNVVTKSGGNDFEGSVKVLMNNDEWNEQNKTRSETTGASLSRVKFDHVNPTQTYTLGGPFWRDHVWFFGNYEKAKTTGARQQTAITLEEFQQTTISPFWNARVTWQINPNHNVWAKRSKNPTNGFIVDYWGGSAELFAFTSQNQSGGAKTAQWTGLFGSTFSAEFTAAETEDFIAVVPYKRSALHNGAPHFSLADGRFYNGATFDGLVNRPKKQYAGAVSIYKKAFDRVHDIKVGFDHLKMTSSNLFAYPNDQLYIDTSFNPTTRTFVPAVRRDYDPRTASASKGKITSFYVRDKLDLMPRLFTEIGVRYEKQTGASDVGASTVDTKTISPRFSASYDLRGDGKTLLVGSAGRFYQFIIQNFSDAFANVPQQTNFDVYTWDGTQYVKTGRNQASAASFPTNDQVNPTYVDELTFGFQRQIGNTIGVGLRGVWRDYGDLIDDLRGFNADGTTFRRVVNYEEAKRKYKSVEATLEKRFSNRWYAAGNYTWSKAEGNHFGDAFTDLGNWLGQNCTTGLDPTIGTNGTVSCSEVQNGSNKYGLAPFDRPHNLKAQGAYSFSLGPVGLSLGTNLQWISGANFTKNRTVTVLNPAGGNSGFTASYFYDKRGTDRLESLFTQDVSIEATYRIWKSVEVGFKGEAFNIFDNQQKVSFASSLWCNNFASNASATCVANRNNYSLATARGHFNGPRTYRVTTLLRF